MPHIHEKIDYTADVLVVHKHRVLLRKHEKYNIWLCVGGHIELDEDPNQAALREVKEEVGLDVELVDSRTFIDNEKDHHELIAPVALNRHRISPTHEHISFVYFARSNSDRVVPEAKDDQWKWCEENDIDSLEGIPANVAHWAKRALKEVK